MWWASSNQLRALRAKNEVPQMATEKGILPPDCFWFELQHQLLPEFPACQHSLQILDLSAPKSCKPVPQNLSLKRKLDRQIDRHISYWFASLENPNIVEVSFNIYSQASPLLSSVMKATSIQFTHVSCSHSWLYDTEVQEENYHPWKRDQTHASRKSSPFQPGTRIGYLKVPEIH